jgi:signal transduction histidine kinase
VPHRVWTGMRRVLVAPRARFVVAGESIAEQSDAASYGDLRYLAALAFIAFTYFISAKLGFSLAFATEQVTAFWPPTGIALAVLLIAGYRAWPGIFLGALLANATSDETLLTAAGIAVGNTLTGLIGVFLLRGRYKFRTSLERTRDIVRLVAVAMLSTLFSSTLGTLNLIVSHIVTAGNFFAVWRVWWVGDTLGILLVAPFMLSWLTRPRVQWQDWRLFEYGALFASLILVGWLALANSSAPASHLSVYATFPFLLWAAFRFEQREVVSCTVIIAGIAVWGAIHDLGPFGTGTLDERLIALDLFAGITGVTALLLGAVTAERRKSQERLRLARNELERRVAERTEQLERANEELCEFAYSMSHDLRAPLRAVNAFSELLTQQSAQLDQEGRRMLSAILRNSRYMGQMIEDYLRLFRLRDEPLKLQRLDVQGLAHDIIANIFQTAGNAKVSFDVRVLPEAVCDGGLIRQAFVNLIDNAVKFSRNCEQPSVEIGGHQTDEEVTYYVKDNGVGFEPEWSGQLFKIFQRLHPREFEGIGMGLAIVACIVQRHGGSVRAQGKVNGGATFSFSLPRSLN